MRPLLYTATGWVGEQGDTGHLLRGSVKFENSQGVHQGAIFLIFIYYFT